MKEMVVNSRNQSLDGEVRGVRYRDHGILADKE